MKNVRLYPYLLLVVVLATFAIPSVLGQDDHNHETTDVTLTEEDEFLLHEVRGGTALFHDVSAATDAGYGLFQTCFTYGTESAQGQHYVHGDYVSDDVIDPMLPEALVYEPGPDGEMILVALEYLVFADVWDPDGSGREAPSLFGQEFSLESHIPETPPVWALHVWLYAHNPDGLFAHWNPLVFCPEGADVVDMSMTSE